MEQRNINHTWNMKILFIVFKSLFFLIFIEYIAKVGKEINNKIGKKTNGSRIQEFINRSMSKYKRERQSIVAIRIIKDWINSFL